MIAITFLWRQIQTLCAYFAVIVVLYLAEWALQGRLGNSKLWKSWFSNSAFVSSMLGMQILRLAVAAIMILALLVIKKKPGEFFLAKGELNANAEPIPPIMTRPEPWSKLGPNLALFTGFGTLVFFGTCEPSQLGSPYKGDGIPAHGVVVRSHERVQ
ncbi:MAG TPA: hypothetical protein VGK00_04210 [Anaerolineales bacterium]|jgi:hypothetical protein